MNRLLKRLLAAGLLASLAGAAAAALWVYWVLIPGLPPTDKLRELHLEEPLRVYTADGALIGEFGSERRAPLPFADMPQTLVQAFLAAEDDRFFEHPGVDWQGLVRAAFKLAVTGEKTQGGSTITMQLARNVFLTRERTYIRKLREILLALQIERDLSKAEILELYLNKIFLGNRAYGVGAAARVYFDRAPEDLSLSQVALLAGLPKAPSRDNPVADPARATERRNYVLRRMRELEYIDALAYEAAKAEPVLATPERLPVDVDAYYVAEMVRSEMVERFGESAYTEGFVVTTTVDAALQAVANRALRQALRGYDARHEYRGPEGRLPEGSLGDAVSEGDGSEADPQGPPDAVADALAARPDLEALPPAVVLEYPTDDDGLKVLAQGVGVVEIAAAGLKWAALAPEALSRGDIVRITRPVSEDDPGWRLAQVPEVQGAVVSVDPRRGAIRALVGGYDFFQGKFNRVLQARRQAGSGFKPFLYSAALEYGFTPASVILDAPVVFDDPALEATWRPENYTGKFYGPTRLRQALVHSRNLVSIRVLQAIGIDFARTHAARFGFSRDRMRRDLTLALGSASFTPLEIARAFGVFANGGFLVEPYLIAQIRKTDGEVLFEAAPPRACPECPEARIAGAATEDGVAAPAPVDEATQVEDDAAAVDEDPLAARVLEPRLVYLVRDMLRDVVTYGTGARARALGRSDLAGKTGTTNDEADAWFSGFHATNVSVVWIGFDQPRPLGRGEVGGRAALPVWMDVMSHALEGQPEAWPERPPGLVSVRINPETGELSAAGSAKALFEIVQAEHVPEPESPRDADGDRGRATVEELY